MQLRQGAALPGGFSDVSEVKTVKKCYREEWGTPGQGDPFEGQQELDAPQNCRLARTPWVWLKGFQFGSAQGLGSREMSTLCRHKYSSS